MNRRSFLKLLGVGVAAPSAVAAALKSKKPVFTRELLIKAVADMEMFPHPISPIMIGGKRYYVAVVHPHTAYQLKVLSARDNYKHESHVRRWEKRYGEQYPTCEGEVGTFEGVNWIS